MLFFVVLAVFVQQIACSEIKILTFQQLTANQNEQTYYQIEFIPTKEIQNKGNILIQFPQQFTNNDIQNLECFITVEEKKEQKSCFYDVLKTQIIIDTPMIEKNRIILLTIGKIRNIGSKSLTGYQLYTRRNDVIIEFNYNIGSLIVLPEVQSFVYQFTPNAYPVLTDLNIQSNTREFSEWNFEFQTAQNFQDRILRMEFPEGFLMEFPKCLIQKNHKNQKSTSLTTNLVTPRIVECQLNGIQILNIEVYKLRIESVYNQYFSGATGNFILEILRSKQKVLEEKIIFASFPQIYPSQLQITFSGQKYRLYRQTIFFQIDTNQDLGSQSQIFIEFLNGNWQLYGCELINSLQQSVCEKQNSQMKYIASQLPTQKQLVFGIDVLSPDIEGDYSVEIVVFDTEKTSIIEQGEVKIQINSTYGTSEVWRAHPMNAPTTLKAGQQGPIELTFFLSSPLPGLTSVILLTLTPALPVPSGVLKCYFFSSTLAPCTVQTTASYTAFTINPPSDFQESEIPITVTYEGGSGKGVLIGELIRRYKIAVHVWDQNCGVSDIDLATQVCIPVNVYFQEFIPEYFVIPKSDLQARAFVHNMWGLF